MKSKDMIEVLRIYRHDLMNDLQIVQGYLTMGKVDKVETKLQACMAHFDEERKLMSLNAPEFALWLIQFNSIHANFRLTYHINMENKSLQALDNALVKYCQICIELIEEVANETELYEGDIQLDFLSASSTLNVQLSMSGDFKESKVLKIDPNINDQNFLLTIQQEESRITCNIVIACN